MRRYKEAVKRLYIRNKTEIKLKLKDNKYSPTLELKLKTKLHTFAIKLKQHCYKYANDPKTGI